jgi:hypothetical protein
MRFVLPLVALLALVTACAAQPSSAESSSSSTGSSPSADAGNELVVELDRGDGSPAERWTLTCGGTAAGSHPAAQAACDHLSGMDDPFASLPDDMVCTQVYDGPRTAHVTGRWQGEPVDVQLARNDGCRIAQWDGLGPLLPS